MPTKSSSGLEDMLGNLADEQADRPDDHADPEAVLQQMSQTHDAAAHLEDLEQEDEAGATGATGATDATDDTAADVAALLERQAQEEQDARGQGEQDVAEQTFDEQEESEPVATAQDVTAAEPPTEAATETETETEPGTGTPGATEAASRAPTARDAKTDAPRDVTEAETAQHDDADDDTASVDADQQRDTQTVAGDVPAPHTADAQAAAQTDSPPPSSHAAAITDAPSAADPDDDVADVAVLEPETETADNAPAAPPSPAAPRATPPAPTTAPTTAPRSTRRRDSVRALAQGSLDLKGFFAPILITFGLVMLAPAIWAVLILLGKEVLMHDRANVQTLAKLMLIAWPISLILLTAGVICLVQVVRGKRAAKDLD